MSRGRWTGVNSQPLFPGDDGQIIFSPCVRLYNISNGYSVSRLIPCIGQIGRSHVCVCLVRDRVTRVNKKFKQKLRRAALRTIQIGERSRDTLCYPSLPLATVNSSYLPITLSLANKKGHDRTYARARVDRAGRRDCGGERDDDRARGRSDNVRKIDGNRRTPARHGRCVYPGEAPALLPLLLLLPARS